MIFPLFNYFSIFLITSRRQPVCAPIDFNALWFLKMWKLEKSRTYPNTIIVHSILYPNFNHTLYMTMAFLGLSFVPSLVTQMVKNLPARQETQVWSLGLEDPLENRMAALSSILVSRIPWTEEPGGLQSMGSQRVGQNWATNTDICVIHIAWENQHVSTVRIEFMCSPPLPPYP